METKFKSISEFKRELFRNPELQEEFKNNPVEAAKKIEQKSPLDTDVWIYRIVVFALGATLIAIIVGVLLLMGSDVIKDDKSVPTILTAIGSAAIGALAGLLAPSPREASKE